MGVDATHKWPTEGFARPWPDQIVMNENTKKKVDAMWTSLGLGKMQRSPRRISLTSLYYYVTNYIFTGLCLRQRLSHG